MAIAATRVRDRVILLASAGCMICSLLFLLLVPAGTPATMLVAAKSAMMIALLGLRAASGFSNEDAAEEERVDGR